MTPIDKKQVTPLVEEAELFPRNSKGENLVDKVKWEITVIAELATPKTLDITKFKEGIQAYDRVAITFARYGCSRD